MRTIIVELGRSLRILILLDLLVAIAYPACVCLVAQAVCPEAANGTLVTHGGRFVGSSLLAQPFTQERWFWPRPSAVGYDAAGSGGSNAGPLSKTFLAEVAARVQTYRQVNGLASGAAVPADAVLSSASGLDPEISLENARLQAPRVAARRGMPLERLLALIEAQAATDLSGLAGEPRVNVLRLNLALEQEKKG